MTTTRRPSWGWRVGLTATVAVAAVATVGGGAPAHADGAELTAGDVAEFLDNRFPDLMAEQDIPGAVVSVVAGGEELVTAGYGDADHASRQPVDPERTAFLVGSVGKSFTAAALLQLADAGEIDLHADVNTYLSEDARLPDTFPGQPVTAHHLLTHTAGFEDTRFGSATADPADALPLSEYVAGRQPDRVYPPGLYTAYSNYGITLAGYLVEEVAGQPFREYTAEHLFAPLGMADSAFVQAQDEAAEEPRVATRYPLTSEGGREPAPDLGGLEYPAGMAFTTGGDMARFMLALLGDGEHDGNRVLRPETARSMLSRQAGTHPETAGVGYGTYERYSAEPRVVGHYGDFLGANAEYALVPERDVGIFVAVNGDAPTGFQEAAWHVLVEEFLTELVGVEPGVGLTEPTDPTRPLADYARGYHAGRVSYGDLTMLPAVLESYRPAAVDGDGLRMSCSTAMEEQRWVPVGDGLFHSADGTEWAGYVEDGGEVVGFVCDGTPTHPYVAAERYETPQPHLAVAGAALAILLSVLAWPLAALVRRSRGRTRPPDPLDRAPRRARLVAGLAVLLLAGALGTLGALFTSDAMPVLVFTGSPLPTVPLAVVVPAAAAVAVLAVTAWRRAWWTVPGRLHYSAVALALVVFLAVANRFHLVWTPWS